MICHRNGGLTKPRRQRTSACGVTLFLVLFLARSVALSSSIVPSLPPSVPFPLPSLCCALRSLCVVLWHPFGKTFRHRTQPPLALLCAPIDVRCAVVPLRGNFPSSNPTRTVDSNRTKYCTPFEQPSLAPSISMLLGTLCAQENW